MNSPHVLVLPSWLECKWGAGGSFFLEQAVIMQKIANWQIRMLMPCAHHISKIINNRWPVVKGVKVDERNGVEVWLGYYPYYLPRNPIHAKEYFGEKLFLQYVEKHGKPDFLWVQGIPHAANLAQHLHKKYGIPYFIHEHVSIYGKKKLRPSICRRLLEVIEDSVYCIAVSDLLRRDMLRWLPAAADKIGVIPNPIGMDFGGGAPAPRVAPAPRRQNLFTFISTSYFRRGKHVDVIIRAFADVHAESPNSRLLLIGNGELETLLKDLVKELRLSDVIIFIGEQTREQLCESLRAADAFVSASEYETFGLVLIEALACGLPAINTNVGIAAEAINDENGIIVESPSAEGIATAMQKVMRGKYDSTKIQKAARRQFSPKIFAQSIQEKLA